MYSYEMTKLKIQTVKKIVNREITITEAIKIIDVSRQSISKWIAKYKFGGEKELKPKKPGPKNQNVWNKTISFLEEKIIEIAENKPFKGPNWITDQIEEKINQSTIYRILKRNNIRYYQNYKHSRRKRKSYCLEKVGQELQLDTCFPFGYQRKEVVFDCIDDCSRWIFAEVMPDKTTQSAIEFVKKVIAKAPFRIEAFRTDRGTEFSKEFEEFLNSQGIELRRNPPYTPQHNGKIERYHRTFKEEVVSCWNFNAPIDELNFYIFQWTSFYNYRKKHTGLGMNG